MSTSPLLQLPNTYRAFYGSFTALRAFQQDVIAPILRGQDVILQAATGSGKTEAVLAPCLERVLRSARTEKVLYVVPTRALVHDLRRRLEPLLHDRLGMQLGLRTGDVKRLPGGQADLLLTTPESLDVMLGSANREVRTFLEGVTMLVVDEVHQLIQGYRGRHLAYLVQRLEQRRHRRLAKNRPVRHPGRAGGHWRGLGAATRCRVDRQSGAATGAAASGAPEAGARRTRRLH